MSACHSGKQRSGTLLDLYSYNKRIFPSIIAGIDISLAIIIHCSLTVHTEVHSCFKLNLVYLILVVPIVLYVHSFESKLFI
ncbi:hypothetical protein BDV40DRAFT_282181 [Aspergillus tamarii]|uniref:Uncharacterized protein n=1 Tax=Aspergillus tamarii TaxID=41984 RepID=A0A5N6UBV6_ASPTM|nr:hypothetical protein BDV40DRAFT_282181 [Aspergillus tamarii]